MSKIKICGLKRPEDIRMVNELLPDFCGFIIDFPKSHRSRTPDEVRQLVKGLDRAHVVPVGVFVNAPVETVAALLQDGTIAMAQLHGSEDNPYIRQLRTLTDRPIIKAYAVKTPETLREAAGSIADYVLLDQGKGSGMTFDWSSFGTPAAREIFGPTGTPKGDWFLAGGLNHENIAEAIRRFSPYAVDLSSAVESDGVKDYEKTRRIIETVRSIKP